MVIYKKSLVHFNDYVRELIFCNIAINQNLSEKFYNKENKKIMENVFDEQKAQEELEKGYEAAEKILNDPDKFERFLQRLEKKLKIIPKLGDKFSKVPVMASLIRSFVKKEYKDNVASYFIEDSLIRDNPLVAPLAELSAREKAVTLLIEQGYDTDYIAKILNTTQNGVRSSKRKALIKIRESAVIPEETKEYLIGILTRNRQ